MLYSVLRWAVEDSQGLREYSGISLSGAQRFSLPVAESFLQSAVLPYVEGIIPRVSVEDVDRGVLGLLGKGEVSGIRPAQYVASVHLKGKVSNLDILVPLCSVKSSALRADGQRLSLDVENAVRFQAQLLVGEELSSDSWVYSRGHKILAIRKGKSYGND